jgi:hypothetical protein
MLERNFLLARDIISIIWILIVSFGSFLVTGNWFFVLLISGLSGLLLFITRQQYHSNEELVFLGLSLVGRVGSIVAVFVATSVAFVAADGLTGNVTGVVASVAAGGVAGGVAGLVAGIVAVVVTSVMGVGVALLVAIAVAGIAAFGVALIVATSIVCLFNSSQLLFLLGCWLIGFSLSPAQNPWLGMIIIPTVVALGFKHLSWGSLLAVPFAVGSYYRLLPDYSLLAQISNWPSSLRLGHQSSDSLQLLKLLPPHTTELLWLPLPKHPQILSAAFRTNGTEALKTFQQMQESKLPGFQDTIREALPEIVADQLKAVGTIRELVITATQQHRLLPSLVPTFYQSETELQIEPRLPTSSPPIEDEISKLLPRLQTIARDVNRAISAEEPALRVRGLERIRNNLRALQEQWIELEITELAIQRWEPVLKQWEQVIERELEQQKINSWIEINNPFQYGNPLKLDRAYLFKGRQAFADELLRQVLDSSRPTLVLHGPRRCGKSSFLLNLRELLPSKLLPVYLDMQNSAVTTNEAAFCQSLVRTISKDSRSQGVELPAIPQRKEFHDTPYIALEDWLEEALPKLGNRRLLLNLDEFEKIGSAINEGRLSLRLFDQLRHLIQHYDQLGFLFSGVQTLDELGPNWSSYFISVVPIEMLYLKPPEAKDLLVNPDPEFTLRYDTGIVEEILTLTRCHPYLLQLIGSSLVKLANERHSQLVTSDLLQAAIPEAFTNGQPYFTNVWTEFTGTSRAEVKAGQELLLALAQGNQSSSVAGNETAQAARRRLLRYHVIENINGSDRFEVPLIERWVRERAITN